MLPAAHLLFTQHPRQLLETKPSNLKCRQDPPLASSPSNPILSRSPHINSVEFHIPLTPKVNTNPSSKPTASYWEIPKFTCWRPDLFHDRNIKNWPSPNNEMSSKEKFGLVLNKQRMAAVELSHTFECVFERNWQKKGIIQNKSIESNALQDL